MGIGVGLFGLTIIINKGLGHSYEIKRRDMELDTTLTSVRAQRWAGSRAIRSLHEILPANPARVWRNRRIPL